MVILLLIPLFFFGAYIYPYIPGHDLPWCAIKIATGIDCPGCGMVRSISALVHGNVVESLRYHPLGIVVAGWMAWMWIEDVAQTFRSAYFGRSKDLHYIFSRTSSRGGPASGGSSAAASIFLAALFTVWVIKLVI